MIDFVFGSRGTTCFALLCIVSFLCIIGVRMFHPQPRAGTLVGVAGMLASAAGFLFFKSGLVNFFPSFWLSLVVFVCLLIFFGIFRNEGPRARS